MYGEDTSETGPRGTFETYRAEGDSLFKNGEFKKAIESYTTALEIHSDDKDCLVARSKCYLQLGDTKHALTDAEASLKEEQNFHKGLYQKAEALYCKGEFELALVFYHRGHNMRPELQEFRLGIQKAQEAIDNSVGSPEKVKLTKEGDLSFFEQLAEPAKKGRTKKTFQRPPTGHETSPPICSRSATNDKTIKQLLGELYGDRVYLEKLLKETDAQSQTGRSIYDLVCDGIKYLDTRTEFWRQQKPMYARKRDKIVQRGRKSAEKGATPDQYVISELEKIDEEQNEGKYTESLKRAKKCMSTVTSYPENTIHNRNEVVANLHSCMGNSFLEMGEADKALHHHQRDMDLGIKYKLSEARSRALDNLGRVYARTGEYNQAISVWSQKVPLCRSPLERTWLHHEIGRCHLELRQFQEARDRGEQAATAARDADDQMWHLNATILVAQAEVKMAEYQAALGSFEKALDMAKLQGDDAAKAAIEKAIQDINHRIVQGLRSQAKSAPKEESSPEAAAASAPEPQESAEDEGATGGSPEAGPDETDCVEEGADEQEALEEETD